MKRSSFWTLALGVAIGGASMASFKGWPGVTAASATPPGNQRLASAMSSGSMATLRALDSSFETLAAAVEPAVVNIHVKANAKPGEMMGGAVEGTGSGVIIRPDGYIITNDHVVDGMDSVTVTLTDGRVFPGKVIRGDGTEDIAIVKIAATNLPTLPFADSNKARAGQIAMAVGSPFDLNNSVTIGHISGLDRPNEVGDPRSGQVRVYSDLLQTDASINPGNSGGALVNIDGELVGINTMIATQSGSSSGVGFAIPSNEARLLADMLIDKGTIKRALIGVLPEPLTQIQEQQLGVTQGAYVSEVAPGTPAEKAGFEKGDVIVRVGSTPIATYMDVRDTMYKYSPGDKVNVEVVRDGHHKTLNVTLGAPVKPTVTQRPQLQNPFGGDPFGGGNPFQFNFPGPRGGGQAPSQAPGGPPHLGARIAPITDATRSQYNLPSSAHGVVVDSVAPGSLAEYLGLKPGDVISQFGGTNVTTPNALVKQIQAAKPGDSGSITFERFSQNGLSSVSRTFTFK
ncbi:MAG: trypsin-like peptidase domain-containing protein [Fimbriimonadaceae bacterium]